MPQGIHKLEVLSNKYLELLLKIIPKELDYNIASCAIWLWNVVYYIKGGTQAKGTWKQDPGVNIWAQEGWEWGVEKTPQ